MNMRLILLLALLLSLPALVPLAATAEGDQGVLHPLLREKLATAASDEQLEIIVQFRPAMTDDDLAVARALGVEVIRTYAAIDGFYGRGAPDDIRALSNYAPVFWMEFNAQLAYAMHDTTHVVEAVKTWHSVIVDTDGEPRDDGFGDYEHIDGSEVAVVVIDTGIDVRHPDYFRADGGLYAWIDVDGDGHDELTTGGGQVQGGGRQVRRASLGADSGSGHGLVTDGDESDAGREGAQHTDEAGVAGKHALHHRMAEERAVLDLGDERAFDGAGSGRREDVTVARGAGSRGIPGASGHDFTLGGREPSLQQSTRGRP